MSCQVCGKPSGKYPLCFACNKEKEEGKVIKCEKCGIWHLISKPCACTPTVSEPEQPKVYNHADDSEDIDCPCFFCGKEARGYFYCRDCYHKYKNKKLNVQITNLQEILIQDVEYEGNYVTNDGHVVKSKSERDIDNYLFEHDIKHAYEIEYYPKNGSPAIKPDFCLTDYLGKGHDVYIEHWGYSTPKYLQSMQYKLDIYRQDGITLICTYEETDAKNISSILQRKLDKDRIKPGEINFLQE